METFSYFNIITLSIFSWYTLDNSRNHNVVTNTSVGICFVKLMIIISCHIYIYANNEMFSRIQETALCQKLNKNLKFIDRDRLHYWPSPPDNDSHEMVDRSINSTSLPNYSNSNEPTHSTLEIPKHYDKVPPLLLEFAADETKPDNIIAAS